MATRKKDLEPFKLHVLFTQSTKMGGYMLFFLRWLAKLVGDGTFTVSACRLPEDEYERDLVLKWAKRLTTLYAYRDDTKIMFVSIGGCRKWLMGLRNAGFMVMATGKVVKRLKAFNRPALLGAHFPFGLRVLVVPDDQYTRHKADIDPKDREKLLDGWIVISEEVHAQLLAQSEFHPDMLRRAVQLRKSTKSMVFNVRVLVEKGVDYLKGNAVRGRVPAGFDIVVSESSVKRGEIVNTQSHCLMLAEPQPGKSEVKTNIQAMINMRHFFRINDMREWIDDHFTQVYLKLTTGNPMGIYGDPDDAYWSQLKGISNGVEESTTRARRWAAVDFTLRGLDVRTSPHMLTQIANSYVDALKNERGYPRIVIPCCVKEQVISESMASMTFNKPFAVKRGTIRRLTSIGVHVVNDLDWIEHYEDWGGHDGDDFFDIYYRKVAGSKRVIPMRLPNEFGGYPTSAVDGLPGFKYVEGEKAPSWTKANGKVIRFPEVNDKSWPTSLSVALKTGVTRYSGLPSQNAPAAQKTVTQQYSVTDFIADVDASMEAGNVGGYIDARMFWDLTFGRHRTAHLCSFEDAIDTATQGGSLDDMQAINAASEVLITEALQSGKPIDRFFWETHGSFSRLAKKLGITPNLYDGRLTKLNGHLDEAIKNFKSKVFHFAQANAAAPPNVLFLGGASIEDVDGTILSKTDSYKWAVKMVEQFRRDNAAILEAANYMKGQDEDAPSKPVEAAWVRIYAPIMDALRGAPDELTRHAMVLSLAAVCYSQKTKTAKRWSDNVIMNNKHDPVTGLPMGPYQYYMDALRFFGIAYDVLELDDLGHIQGIKRTEWDVECKSCGTHYALNNARSVYRFYLADGICTNCRTT